ncbi:HD-GYP domain-containing protein [Virgibacillus oceani]|uniref:HD family phosphohydrolase n=1 Tax=Virgibacillus oceani TaxID=1479511 RepID=A0A917HLI8_9BACI|nr:HD-GYP domain-containing protein [Virgibacillus oceani]GGG82571.1 HD family phosphohydrolase [Virgibacillus oceani]
MRVDPSQLVPGCVLISDVKGKTNRPIVPTNTVLSEMHINVLQKFLVEAVDVSPKLVNGESFTPKRILKEKKEIRNPDKEYELFRDHYMDVVNGYKKMFEAWRNNIPVDMAHVRRKLLPLLERVDNDGSDVFTLHHYVKKEDYYHHHSVSVAVLSAYLAKKLNFAKGECLQIGLAGFLSDCGMAKVDQAILHKQGGISDIELNEIKKHPTYSYRLVEQIPTISQTVKIAILQHHERMDGSGYPIGLTKDKILTYARIIAVSDMYHAMTCERYYKEKQSPFKVMEEIQKEQFSQLDHNVVQTFISSLANFSIGTKVRLSNNRTGEIVFVEDKYPTRPMVRLDHNDEIVTLKNDPSMYIDEIL